MLCVQPLLIRYGQYKWHRIIGWFSYLLVPCIIVSIHFIAREAYLGAIAAHNPKASVIAGLYFPTYQIFDFAALYVPGHCQYQKYTRTHALYDNHIAGYLRGRVATGIYALDGYGWRPRRAIRLFTTRPYIGRPYYLRPCARAKK